MDSCANGIILYSLPFKENSEILQILTKEYGLIGCICRGSKKIKSKFLNKTAKYTYAKFYLQYRENGLSLIKEIDELNYYSYFHKDITMITYLAYLCDLTYSVAKQEKNSEIFDCLLCVLDKITEGLDPLVLTNILEIKYLKYLGINLYLDGCIKCHQKKDIVTLNASSGGFLCKNCYQNEYIVSQNTIKTIRNYYFVDIHKIAKIDIQPITKLEINLFLSNYYENYTGIYIKNKEFLNKLINDY